MPSPAADEADEAGVLLPGASFVFLTSDEQPHRARAAATEQIFRLRMRPRWRVSYLSRGFAR
ncbi:MAG: hypothetical protein DI618_07915 [Dermacoccus nishinomiyaensis]|nr:MAG: hypothetical protein DI618_07915 [Dermacoccus nishinomiyaensis]